jgi:tetratricopeptide (TPR) repeat protein
MSAGWMELPRNAPARKAFDAALTHADTGSPDLALLLLFDALATGPTRDMECLIQRSIAVIQRAVGDFVAASTATQRAYDLTLASNDAEKIGAAMVAVAEDALDNGRFAAVPLVLEQAFKQIEPGTRAQAHIVQAKTALATGDLAGARRAVELADALHASPAVAAWHPTIKLLRVMIDNLTAHTSTTMALCRGIKLSCGEHRDRFAITSDAIRAWAQAVTGQTEAALHAVSALQREADAFAKYVEFRAEIYGYLGHVLFAANVVDHARNWFERALTTCPAPAHLPRLTYFLGLSHVRLGNADSAAAAFNRLIAAVPDTHYATLARNLIAMQTAAATA